MGDEADADWDVGLGEAGAEYVKNDILDKAYQARQLRVCRRCRLREDQPRVKYCPHIHSGCLGARIRRK